MGIAASQARLLTLTSRLNDLEGKAMRFANKKILMSMQQSDLATEYNKKMEAIDALKDKQVTTQTSRKVPVSYQNLVSNGFEITKLNAPSTTKQVARYRTEQQRIANWEMPTTIDELVELLKNFGLGGTKNIDFGRIRHGDQLGGISFEADDGSDRDLYQVVRACIDDNSSNWQSDIDALNNDDWDHVYTFDQEWVEKFLGPMMSDEYEEVSVFDHYETVTEPDWAGLQQRIEDDATALLNEWQQGNISISYNGTQINYTDTLELAGETVTTAAYDKETIASMKKAVDSEYDAEIKKVQTEEKRIDLQATQTNTEHQAVSTEMESVKSLIKDNTDRSFNIFG